MGKLLTQSEYARHRGVTKQYISGLVKQGRITLTNGKIAPDLADQQIKEQSDISHPKNRPADSESTINYKKARLRTLGYDTKMKKIQCEIMEGKWMLNAPIEKFAFEQGRRDRDAILALIDRYEHLYDNPKTQPKAIKMTESQ